MWIRKRDRDRALGVDTPIPSQVVSNEEFIPRPQNTRQKQVESLTMEWGTERARKIGMDRRAYMASSMGIATALLASNKVYGATTFEVDEAEAFEDAACQEKYPKGKFFVIDVQSHFSNAGPVGGFRSGEIARNMGFNLKDDAEAYAFKNFTKEMFLDSDTNMVVISGVPTLERQRAPDGRVLVGKERANGILPSWLMGEKKKELNDLAGSQRALCQGNLAPNHYRNADKTINKAATIEQMERELELYKIDSWKWYCHFDPARTGSGFQLDSDDSQWFIEESRKRGKKLISCHKGYSSQSREFGHLANPKDVEKAALRNPDFNFVVYHSALKHSSSDGDNWKALNQYDPTTGDMLWHNVLMEMKRRNPKMNNVYCEVGSFFNTLVVADPVMCMHGMGLNIKTYGSDHVVWGTDCLWWGSPQWAIEAFSRFQISDELCEKRGYKKITDRDRANILGLNAAKLYGVTARPDRRKGFPKDTLDRIKEAYLEGGGMRDNGAAGWVRAEA